MDININVDLYLRPIRFAFLVNPNNQEALYEVFIVNSFLWGGKFNPIIPCFNEIIPSWFKKTYELKNTRQITKDYLDFFEPDFIVETEPGIADGYGFDPSKIIHISNLTPTCRSYYGLDVRDLYRNLKYKKPEFWSQYKDKIFYYETKNEIFENFIACNFGCLYHEYIDYIYYGIDDRGYTYLDYYKDIFNPKIIELDSDELCKIYKNQNLDLDLSVLDIGSYNIETSEHVKFNYIDYDYYRPDFFIMDATKTIDLIDFWNLRIIHPNTKAIPIQWIKNLADLFKPRRFEGNWYDNDEFDCIYMFSPSVPQKIRKEFCYKYISSNNRCYQESYPEISLNSRYSIFSTQKSLTKNIGIQIDLKKPQISFETLYPEFINELSVSGKFPWANVVNLRIWSSENQIATVFPHDYKNPFFLEFNAMHTSKYTSTKEGIIIFPVGGYEKQRWFLQDGTSAIKKWLENNKDIKKANISDAGRFTQNIIKILGGFDGVSTIANEEIVKLLNEVAENETKSLQVNNFKNRIINSWQKNKTMQERCLEKLVEQNVLELGQSIECIKCSRESYFAIDRLSKKLECNFCRDEFDYPKTPDDLKRVKYVYILKGPFTIKDYAKGGYASALAIRFFANVIPLSECTWSTGQIITLNTNKEIEVDFILWHRGKNNKIQIVFGESKSFGNSTKDCLFKEDDIDRMKDLAKLFPDCILVLSTIQYAENIHKDTIQRIKEFTQWGQENKVPIIFLTGSELFNANKLQISAEEIWDGKFTDLSDFLSSNNLEELAHHTQKMYLSMKSS